MPQHIGIVACSAEGAALCYKTICIEGAGLLGPHAHPEVSMHTHSLADYVERLDRGDRAGVAELMLSSAHKLASAGADFLICPDNTIHQAMDHVLPHSPLPWLHIAEVVAAEAKMRGYEKLGITGMCRGGRTVWMYSAHSKQVKAGVSWYGGLNPMPPAMPLTPMDVADQLNAPVLGLYGGADSGIPQTMVDRMNAGLLAFGKDKQSMIHVYPDMPHAFHADYRPSYRKEAAEDGWKRMLAWFKKHGVA